MPHDLLRCPLFLCRLRQLACDQINASAQLRIVFIDVFNFTARMKYSGVIPAAEMAADLLQTVPRQLPSQIHTDLPRQRDTLASFLALQIRYTNLKLAGLIQIIDRVLNPPRTRRPVRIVQMRHKYKIDSIVILCSHTDALLKVNHSYYFFRFLKKTVLFFLKRVVSVILQNA